MSEKKVNSQCGNRFDLTTSVPLSYIDLAISMVRLKFFSFDRPAASIVACGFPFELLKYKLPFAKVWSLMRCTISSKGGANSESSRWSASQAYVPNGYESVAYRHPLTCLRMSHAFRETPSELSGAHLEMSPRFP